MDSLPDDLLCNLMLDFQPKPAADPLQTGPDPCNVKLPGLCVDPLCSPSLISSMTRFPSAPYRTKSAVTKCMTIMQRTGDPWTHQRFFLVCSGRMSCFLCHPVLRPEPP